MSPKELSSRMTEKFQNKIMFAKKITQIKLQKLGLAILAGCFLASMYILAMTIPHTLPFPSLIFRSSAYAALEKNYAADTETTLKPKMKPLCNTSEPRSELCDMDGDIRIHCSSSSVLFISSTQSGKSDRNESYKIRPYARKGDSIAMSLARQVSVRSSQEGPLCSVNHTVPAIVFSGNGYSGNLFHDFTDLLIPLFLTAREFDGEVQFLVTDMKSWWINKYSLFLRKLSNYEIIDFDKDDRVHCFRRTIVGLRCHKELSIDPSRAPNGYSMVNFTRFMRRSYSLARDAPLNMKEQPDKKPRLLIITRNKTRTFLNTDEIVQMAGDLGFEVIAIEPTMALGVGEFAGVVNSCDVMMGVHGAGLTNLVFLPTNATLIQVVPWGGLRWIAMLDFGDPAADMKLNYIQYEISPEESSLIETYPRDHQIFKNPFAFHLKGWDLLRDTFINKQHVRLNVKRFRPILIKALEHLK